MRIVRASARTMAQETAARWCWKKDWGNARPRPYWVESCPCGSAAGGLVQHVEETDHLRREGAGVLRAEQVYDVALFECVGVVAWLGVDAAHARATVQRRI